MHEYEQLVARIKSDYAITMDSLQFGDCKIEYWRPTDPESILDDEVLTCTHDELPWQPYWAQAWDASLGMCEFLSTRNLNGMSVLDLGCGIGVTSALLLEAGATVVCGDNAPPSLMFAEANTWQWRDRVTVELIDWHQTVLSTRFDLIVGSDIVYDRKEVEPLDQFFRKHLSPAGNVVLSDPSRPMTREYLDRFQQLGWKLHESTVELKATRQPTRIVQMSVV